MHQLRLFKMLVERHSVILIDYDFRTGRSHFAGKGWRSLIALAMVLTFFTAIVSILANPAKPAGFLGIGIFDSLLGMRSVHASDAGFLLSNVSPSDGFDLVVLAG